MAHQPTRYSSASFHFHLLLEDATFHFAIPITMTPLTTRPVALACDHAGVALKAMLAGWLKERGYGCTDLGTQGTDSVDYPDYGHALAEHISHRASDFGIAICGSGVGISIAANRHAGIRAALCHTPEAARLARAHNDANVLALGARMIKEEDAPAIVDAFLHTPFEGGRHTVRVEKLG